MEFCFQKFYKILSLHFMLCLCFFLLEYRAVDLNFFFAKLSKYLWHSWIKSIRGVVSLCHKTFLEIYIAGFYLILGQHAYMIIIFQCKFMQQYCSSTYIYDFHKIHKVLQKKYTAYNSLLCGNVPKFFFDKKIKRF